MLYCFPILLYLATGIVPVGAGLCPDENGAPRANTGNMQIRVQCRLKILEIVQAITLVTMNIMTLFHHSRGGRQPLIIDFEIV